MPYCETFKLESFLSKRTHKVFFSFTFVNSIGLYEWQKEVEQVNRERNELPKYVILTKYMADKTDQVNSAKNRVLIGGKPTTFNQRPLFQLFFSDA